MGMEHAVTGRMVHGARGLCAVIMASESDLMLVKKYDRESWRIRLR